MSNHNLNNNNNAHYSGNMKGGEEESLFDEEGNPDLLMVQKENEKVDEQIANMF